jgi:hypothetical protein
MQWWDEWGKTGAPALTAVLGGETLEPAPLNAGAEANRVGQR